MYNEEVFTQIVEFLNAFVFALIIGMVFSSAVITPLELKRANDTILMLEAKIEILERTVDTNLHLQE